jgi:cell wall assembly regulator SMI1
MTAVSRAAELLRSLDGHEWVDADGDAERLELLPPLTDAEIDALASAWGVPVPPDAREVLRVARGIEASPLDAVEFSGQMDGAVLDEVFPHPLPIAHDGYGNYWIVDLRPGSDVFGPVFFACHDPAVVVYQCADVAAFVEALAEMTKPPHTGPLDFVHEEASSEIWGGRETAVQRAVALQSDDAVLRAFAETLPPDASIADLRSPRLGDGFRVPRRREFIAHPTERLFAWHDPPRAQNPLARLAARLFGG